MHDEETEEARDDTDSNEGHGRRIRGGPDRSASRRVGRGVVGGGRPAPRGPPAAEPVAGAAAGDRGRRGVRSPAGGAADEGAEEPGSDLVGPGRGGAPRERAAQPAGRASGDTG